MERIAICFAAVLFSGAASAATLTLPSVTISGPTSTTITCTPVASSYPPPLASGSTVFNCTVAPAGWVGAVSLSGTQFVVGNLNGVSFTVNVGPTALPSGTYQPGTLTSQP